MTSDVTHDRAIRRFVVVALVFPLILTALAVTVQLVLLPQMPDMIAIHWNAAGEPDGFAPAWTQPIFTVLFGLGVPALIALTSLPGLRRGDRGDSYRFMGATSAAVSTLVVSLATVTYVLQAGLDSPASIPAIGLPLIGSLCAALIVGVVGWFAQPHEEWPTAPAVRGVPLPLAAGERAVWLRTTSASRGAVVAIVGACVLVSALAVGAWVVGASVGTALVVSGLAVLLIVLAATTLVFHVRVDESGLTVSSALGLPRFRVPLDDVAAATSVDVTPMGEFGGWGLRLAPGRFGVVLRTGEAIDVTRRSRARRFVVTVDDAATGAALLVALRDRAHPERAERPEHPEQEESAL